MGRKNSAIYERIKLLYSRLNNGISYIERCALLNVLLDWFLNGSNLEDYHNGIGLILNNLSKRKRQMLDIDLRLTIVFVSGMIIQVI